MYAIHNFRKLMEFDVYECVKDSNKHLTTASHP